MINRELLRRPLHDGRGTACVHYEQRRFLIAVRARTGNVPAVLCRRIKCVHKVASLGFFEPLVSPPNPSATQNYLQDSRCRSPKTAVRSSRRDRPRVPTFHSTDCRRRPHQRALQILVDSVDHQICAQCSSYIRSRNDRPVHVSVRNRRMGNAESGAALRVEKRTAVD